jgi:DNA/RNA endonuclease YhcR with UshA esterase domain
VAGLEAVVSLNGQLNGVQTLDAHGPDTSSLLSDATSGPLRVEMAGGELRTIVLQSDEVMTNTGEIVRIVSSQEAVNNPLSIPLSQSETMAMNAMGTVSKQN